jgi:tetratricopeptide (TPR) repeat protein
LASVLLKAASFYLSRPQFSRDALKILKMVLTCEPESAQKAAAWFGMAIEHNKNNNYKLALENIDSALKEQPGKSEYLFFKASLLYENNEFDQARECLEKIAETEITDSEQTKMYYMMGQIMEKKGLIDPAADYYKKAVLIKDSDDLTDMSYHRLANIYFNLNNLQKSEENLEKISDKLNFKYFYSMARIYMERRDRERALEYYSKAVKTSLNPVEEIERDYILCLSESDPEKALSYINKKEEQLVKFNSFEVIKSIVLIRNKKIKEGLDYLNTRISKKSYESDSEYFTLAARAYLEGDEPEKTLSLTKRIKSPKTALFLKSMALIKLSRFKESLEEIEKSSFKTDVLFVLPKAMALTGLGQKSKALEFIKKSNLSEKVKKDYISNIELIKKQ